MCCWATWLPNSQQGIGVKTGFHSQHWSGAYQQREFLNDVKKGATTQTNGSGFVEASFYLSDQWTLSTGLRYDLFRFQLREPVE